MGRTVVGLFDEWDDAQHVVNDLEAAGFPRKDISIVASNATQRFGSHATSGQEHSKGGSVIGGAVGGAAEGAVIGGLTGLAASVALLLIPGIGPIAAIGPLSAFLSGAGIGALGGGVIGGLANLGIPHEEAGYYAEGVRRGGTLVTLTTSDDRADEAMRIFDRYNPVDIEERAAYYRESGYTNYDAKAPHYTPEQITEERSRYNTFSAPMASSTMTTPAMNTTATTGTNQTVRAGEEVRVPIVEEQLAVGKREVQRGRARIHTYVQETPVQEQVTLREEHLNVERHAVNRPVGAGDLSNAFQDRTIEVTERAEVPVVAKEARVVEEVVIGKEATQHTETVRDTVRRTEVDVDEDLDTDVTTSTTATTGTTANSNIRR